MFPDTTWKGMDTAAIMRLYLAGSFNFIFVSAVTASAKLADKGQYHPVVSVLLSSAKWRRGPIAAQTAAKQQLSKSGGREGIP